MAKKHPDLRTNPRCPLEDELTYFPFDSKKPHSGLIYNVSRGGLYFQSPHLVYPDAHILIRLNENTTRRFSEFRLFPYYRAKVTWLDKGEDRSASRTGVGVKFLACFDSPEGPNYFCDKCEEPLSITDLRILDDYTFLCVDCYSDYASQAGSARRVMKRQFEGNVI
jgi:hypothetical protein